MVSVTVVIRWSWYYHFGLVIPVPIFIRRFKPFWQYTIVVGKSLRTRNFSQFFTTIVTWQGAIDKEKSEILMNVLITLVKNPVKESFYKKIKKTINVLTVFFISHKSGVQIFYLILSTLLYITQIKTCHVSI